MDITEKYIENYPAANHGLKIAVFYPNSYYLGMSNLGYQGLYHLLKKTGFWVNRFFYDPDKEKVVSPEDKFQFNDADIIFISQSYENDLINIIKAFSTKGIEHYADKRKSPKVIIGGAFPTMNQRVFKNLADYVLTGELELYEKQILSYCEDFPNSNLESLESRVDNKLNQPQYTRILSPNTGFSDTFLIEITRGCRFKCSFCTVPDLFGNLRSFTKEDLFLLIDKGLEHTKKIGLVSALTTDHPDLMDIINYINNRGAEAGFSSLRIEQIDYDFLKLIKENHQNILTIAPEVASAKLKKKIKKNIKEEKLYSLIENTHILKFKKIKLYFIIGFEEEDQTDLDAIIAMIKNIRKISLSFAKENKFMPEIILSINQFIPKALSPLSNEPFIDAKIINKKIQFLKKHLMPIGNISIRTDNTVENYLQWRISQGDETLLNQLIELISNQQVNSQKDLFKVLKKMKSLTESIQ